MQLSTLATLITLFEKIGPWPIGTVLLLVILGPWLFIYFNERNKTKATALIEAARKARFETLKEKHREQYETLMKMYEANIIIIKNYERLAFDLKDVLVLNTSQWSGAKEKLNNVIRHEEIMRK